jgi:uncharacterized protein YkwD
MRFDLGHLFRPQASNKYRSKLLHPQSLLIVSFLLLAFFALFNALRFFPNIANKVLGSESNINVEELLDKTNAERRKLGLSNLVLNQELNQAALAKAQDMFNDQYWAHTAPDGKQAWDFIKEANYVYRYAGENLARDFNTSSEVVTAWMNSPSHYENIANKDFTQMGLAVVTDNLNGFRTTLVVQLFGVPSSVAMKESSGKEFLLPKAAENTNTDTDADTALVAGERSTNSDLVFSKLNLTRTFFLIVVMLIVFTLSYDSFVASSQKYQRVVGQNFAHIALFITVAFLLVLFKGGMVLP